MANQTNGDGFPSSSSSIPFSSIENLDDDDESLSDTDAKPPPVPTRASTTASSTSASSTPDRPNRFPGPSSTYRTHISPERTLHTSLLQQRANDLSLHLYNTHALKLRVRDPNPPDIKFYHAKSRWVKRGDDGKPLWHPKDHWTAWPVRAEDVPREEERFGLPGEWREDHDGETFKVREAWRPTGEMMEELLALMMRKAKEDFRDAKEGLEREKEVDGGSESDVDATEGDDEATAEYVESSATPQDSASESTEVVILADDEAAAEVLQPMINNIMSKLDDLLLALHNSIGPTRSYTRRADPVKRSRSASASRSRSRKRSRSTALPQDDEETSSGNSEAQDDSNMPSRSQSRRPPAPATRSTASQPENQEASTKPRRRRTRHPRDWSSLLATASLVGWDPAVLQRAHSRCEDLFREKTDILPVTSVPSETSPLGHPATVTDAEMPQGREAAFDALTDRTKEREWIDCPVGGCKRVGNPFHEKWRLREHLRRVHGWDKMRIAREA